jgi:hypothetical protein
MATREMMIHLCSWATQGDIELSCGKFTSADWKQPKDLPHGVHKASEHGYYVFGNDRDKVTCPECLGIINGNGVYRKSAKEHNQTQPNRPKIPKAMSVEKLLVENIQFTKTKTGEPMSREYIEQDLKESEERSEMDDKDLEKLANLEKVVVTKN